MHHIDKPIDNDLSGLGNKKDEDLTIEELKPRHKESGYPKGVPRWYIRAFEIFPGVFTWTLLLSPIWAALLGYPQIIVFYMAFLTIFWTLRGARFIYGLIVGYQRIKQDTARDWISEYKELPDYKKMKYVLIYPLVKEGFDVVEPAIQAWLNQDIDSRNITLVFALEKKFSSFSRPTADKIAKEFKDRFASIRIYEHRNDIKGEVQGVKGANINWATRHFVRDILKEGQKIEDYLLVTNDCDFRPHPKYLSAITYRFMTTEKPYQHHFSSAVYTLSNNLWEVPVLVRAFSSFLTLAILHAWVVDGKKRDTFSAYVVSLKTVVEVGYWDPAVGIDDTTFYWNAKIHFDGDFLGKEVYLPCSSDAVQNINTIKTYQSLYKQQHRWGSGVISFPITIASIYAKGAKIPLLRRLKFFWELFDTYVMLTTVVFLLSFALPILSRISPEYAYSSAAGTLPQIMSVLFSVLMLLNIPIYFVRKAILNPPLRKWNIFRILLDAFEIFLITINMLTFTFIPFVQAQTELLFGKGLKKEYYATEKVK